MSAVDVTVNVSTDEGTCTSVLESLACGVPVVSTDTGDINEVVSDGKNGIVVPNGNDRPSVAQRVAEAIASIHDNGCLMSVEYMVYGKDSAMREIGGLLREVAGADR